MDSKVKGLHSRAEYLFAKFQEGGGTKTKYINKAIAFDREALELCPVGHHMRISCLALLGVHLSTRHEHLGGMQDLDEAIVLDREALSLCPQRHPDRSMSLYNIALDLSTRYHQLGVMQDLDEAIFLGREALSLCTQGHSDRSMSLNNLARDLSARYKRLGAMQDLEEAIILDREALYFRPRGHPDRSVSLNNLALGLSSRFIQLGVTQDLDEAVLLSREALTLRPQGHPDRSVSLNNHAVHLTTRYKQLGAMDDLDEAIVLDREALSLCPQGHPDRSMYLSSLAVNLSTRYKQLGAMQDLEEAIVLDREALSLRLHGHPARSTSLNNLAVRLSTRYEQLGATHDLDEAIVLAREALLLRLQGHPGRLMSLNNLAVNLSTRHHQLGAIQDLNEAIILGREALSLCTQGNPDRSMSLNNLAVDLTTRYEQLRAMQDLDEAIVLGREALQLHPKGDPNRSESLRNLAEALFTRCNQLGAKQDLDLSLPGPSTSSSDQQELFSLYAQLTDVTHTVSSHDLDASRAWIRVAESFGHSSTLPAYETSLRLLVQHLSLLPSLPQHLAILKNRTSSLAMDAFSACLRNHAQKHAVELLEQGRGVFWNQLTRLRSPLGDVIASGPAGETLASEFTRLTSLIRMALDSPGVDQHEQVCRLNLEMQRVVTAIRDLPGLSCFLLPLRFSDLQRAANGGPVIIVNASQYSCDALIVSKDQDPVHIPLSINKGYIQHLSSRLRASTVRTKVLDMTRDLGRILRELWHDVVFPVVKFLRTTYPLQSRIWWCPTAEFSNLPLHAAGPYRKGQQNFADLYISSYTSTLSALIHARRPCSSKSVSNMKRFAGIGQTDATGQSKLLSVSSELANIGQCVNGSAIFTQIEADESCISRVAEELCNNQWVHLACHGLANRRRPFESAFALRDEDFTIERIIGCNLEDPEFAYLSACHTTVGDEESPDEVIHLASAMQFAGFRSIIGTMWAVDDAETNKITSTFYRHMLDEFGRLDHTRAAFALNKTMRSVDVPLDQRILYIHLGA